MNIVDKAVEFAAVAHKNQVRKGTGIPYIVHPYEVGMILLRAECSDEVIAAGILHDTVEDTPVTLIDIKREFGERIAYIVGCCSEPDKSLTWEVRKRHTIECLRTADEDVRIVSCADKLNNIRSLYKDGNKDSEIWKRFRRGKEEQGWYYKSLVESLGLLPYTTYKKQQVYENFKEMVYKVFK